MNEKDLSKLVKKMPSDLAAESAEFAKTGREKFRMRAPVGIALSVVLVAVGAGAAIAITAGNRNRSSVSNYGENEAGIIAVNTDPAVTPGPEDQTPPRTEETDAPHPTAGPTEETGVPHPTAGPYDNLVTVDLKGLLPNEYYRYGALHVNDCANMRDFLTDWESFVYEYKNATDFELLSASERLYRIKLERTVSDTGYGSVSWADVSPLEISGIAQLFRCEYLSSYTGDPDADGGENVSRFTMDVLYADGRIVKVFLKECRLVLRILPLDVGNAERKGLLIYWVSDYPNGMNTDSLYLYGLSVYDPGSKAVRDIEPAILSGTLSVTDIDGAVYVFNTDTLKGGKAEYDPQTGTLSVGGVDPAVFFSAVFGNTGPVEPPESTEKSIPDPTPTPTPPHTPDESKQTPVPVVTDGPGATMIPQDDPSSIYSIESHTWSLMCYEKNGGSIQGPEIAKGYYFFTGIEMVYDELDGDLVQTVHTVKELTGMFKRNRLHTINAEKGYFLSLNDDVEFVSAAVWAINDAADVEKIEPAVIASGLTEAGLEQFISSGSMQFRETTDGSLALPCFVVVTTKLRCSYIETTGEYEYLFRYSIIPFLNEESHFQFDQEP